VTGEKRRKYGEKLIRTIGKNLPSHLYELCPNRPALRIPKSRVRSPLLAGSLRDEVPSLAKGKFFTSSASLLAKLFTAGAADEEGFAVALLPRQ
jgi:hypothetical protein